MVPMIYTEVGGGGWHCQVWCMRTDGVPGKSGREEETVSNTALLEKTMTGEGFFCFAFNIQASKVSLCITQ